MQIKDDAQDLTNRKMGAMRDSQNRLLAFTSTLPPIPTLVTDDKLTQNSLAKLDSDYKTYT